MANPFHLGNPGDWLVHEAYRQLVAEHLFQGLNRDRIKVHSVARRIEYMESKGDRLLGYGTTKARHMSRTNNKVMA